MSGLSAAKIIGRSLRKAKYRAGQESQCWRRYPILRCCKRQAGDHRKKKKNRGYELGERWLQIRCTREEEKGIER